MRILHVAKKFPRLIGGDATAVASLARVQERAGHEVFVVTSNSPAVDDAPRVYRVGPIQDGRDLDRITVRRLRTMAAVRRWCRREMPRLGPDVVHAHSPDLGFAAAGEAHRRRIPIVITCHGLWFPVWGAWSLRGRAEITLLRRSEYDAIATVARADADALRSRGFRRIVHVPNGVDAEEFSGPRRQPQDLRFLFAGRHEPQKGLDVLLEAVSALRRESGPPFRVVLLGDGSLTPALKRRARALGLDGIVTFAGRLERADVVRAYREASAFVLPSRYEGFPIAILEAWAAGLPVIATGVGGVAEICGPENAILVPPGSPSALATAMDTLLRDPGLRQRLGSSGHQLVRERFTWDAVSARYREVYEAARADRWR